MAFVNTMMSLGFRKDVPFVDQCNNCRLLERIVHRGVGCRVFNVRTKHSVWQ